MRIAANANQVFLAQRVKLKLLGILACLGQPLLFGQFSGRDCSRLVVIGSAHNFGLYNNGRVALTTPKILEKVQQIAHLDGLLLELLPAISVALCTASCALMVKFLKSMVAKVVVSTSG